ncbi:MAG: S24 family peptidase [Rhodospirillales bacterium]|nr:S24 family peptidase [Rhodospirillales bacterium]
MIERTAEICNALGLEFYVGPARGRGPAQAVGGSVRGEGAARRPDGAQRRRAKRPRIGQSGARRGRQPAPAGLARRDVDRARGNARGDSRAAAGGRGGIRGGGGEIDSERVRGLVWFTLSWPARLGLDATKCAIIRGRGESMEPTLPDGCSILFDRNRRERREGGIYLMRTSGGLIVKRAAKRGGGWELTSGNPAVEPEPWPAEAEAVGEVVWAALTLI